MPGPEGVVPSISDVQAFVDVDRLGLFKLLSSDDEPLLEAVDEADEQVVDITSKALSLTFFAGVDFVESEVVGLKTPTAAPRDDIC